MNLTKRFRLAAYFSIANAVLSLPLVVASVLTGIAEASGAISGLASRIITAVMSIVIYALAIYVLVALRELFEQRYGYQRVSGILKAFIYLYAVFMLLSALGLISSAMETAVGILSVIAMIVVGVMSIVYGIRLLSFNEDLYGCRKPYAAIEIATGVCLSTVLLMPLGLLLNIASNIFLAIIFFREAETMINQQGENP
jgi:hypothetical protein